jgi:hypothetical protein
MNAMNRRNAIFALLAACVCASDLAMADGVSPAAQSLARFYDSLNVEQHWIAGTHVDWTTGDPDGASETLPGRHTHCSAFVAAAAKKLGVYILRPPEHGQVLLANAQNEWLAGAGPTSGWRPIPDAVAAQAAANRGLLVVASYHNHRDNKPGHIAIVRPSAKSDEAVRREGPDVIQAATQNASKISLAEGFAGHPHAWEDHEVQYYAHAIGNGKAMTGM